MNNDSFKPVEHYIYYRVSTSKQASDQAHGLDMQVSTCETYANQFYNIKENQINYYCDIGSSYNLKSSLPQLRLLIKNLVPNSVIMISDVSRLGRDTIGVFFLLKKIREKKCIIVSVKDNLTFGLKPYQNKLFYNKIISSEIESDIKSIRGKKLIDKIRKDKIHFGTIPFGFKLDQNKKLVIDSTEQVIIKALKSKYKEIGSYSKVANLYNKSTTLYRGQFWTGRRVSYLINRKMNINTLVKNINRCSL